MGKHSVCAIDIYDKCMQYPEVHKRRSNADGDIIMRELAKDGAVKAT